MTNLASSMKVPPHPTVLLVEDDRDSLDMYALALQHGGLAVTPALNGAEALDRAFALLPDLVVTDVVMPVLDGLTLHDRLREDPRTRLTPIIAVTARPMRPAELDRLAGDEATSVLYKPCEPQQLVVEIRRMLEISRVLREHSRQAKERAAAALAKSANLHDRVRRLESRRAQRTLDRLARRIRCEYGEVPGLSLTPLQASRLLNLDPAACERVLDSLARAGFLVCRRGRYMRA
jgi:CheY-like chemotaxis protein